MKLTTEDEYSIVTIESKETGLSIDKVVQMFRSIAHANEYSSDNIAALIPNEHQLDEMISDAIKAQKEDLEFEVRYALNAIDDQCRFWLKHGYKHVTKDKMLEIIQGMSKSQENSEKDVDNSEIEFDTTP